MSRATPGLRTGGVRSAIAPTIEPVPAPSAVPLLTHQRNEHGECAVTKVNHETWETQGVIASSLERLLWFVLSDLQGYLRPDGEFKDEDELEHCLYSPFESACHPARMLRYLESNPSFVTLGRVKVRQHLN